MRFKIWFAALRLPFLTATFVPVLLGTVIGWNSTGKLNWLYFLVTLIGVSCMHLGTNLANDYFDHKTKNDELNLNYTAFNGGSRVIQDGLVPPEQILIASLLFFTIGSLLGLYLNWRLTGNVILILGVIGVACGFFYTSGSLRVGYRGIGEMVVGLCFGPLVVLGSYYVQTESFSLTPLLASIPVGILIALVLYINEFPDYDADKTVHKKTIVVMLGKQMAVKVYHVLLALVYVYILGCILFRGLPYYAVLVLFTIPVAIKIYYISKKNFSKVSELLPANLMTIQLHLSIGLLISFAFVLDRIF